jgi:hypothetical protein
MNKHEYQRTHNLHKNIYEKFDYIINQNIMNKYKHTQKQFITNLKK